MKKFYFTAFFLILLSHSLLSQTSIIWSEPLTVATSSFGSASPRIALLPDGSPVLLWGKTGINAKIYFSRWENESFTAPLQINTNGIAPDVYGFGGLDLATHSGMVFLVFENFDNGIYLVRSEDGGQNFELPVSVYNPQPGDWTTLPSLAVDENGNLLVSVIRELTTETEARYILMRSTDGGLTFDLPVVASEPAAGEYVCECCPSDIYAAGGSVWLIFRNNDNNLRDIWVSSSTDQGASFDVAADVDATDWVVNSCPISGPSLAPLASDSLLAVWMSGASGIGRVSFSTLNGATMEKGWEYEFPQTNANAQQSRPDLAGANDTIGVVWEETGFGVNSTDLMFAFSKTGAAGLTSNFSNITQATGAQRYPSLAYANGCFHLAYSDANGALTYVKGVISDLNSSHETGDGQKRITLINQPVRESLRVRLESHTAGSAGAVLFDAGGRMIKTWKDSTVEPGINFLELEIGEWPAGVYFLQIKMERATWTGKVLFLPSNF